MRVWLDAYTQEEEVCFSSKLTNSRCQSNYTTVNQRRATLACYSPSMTKQNKTQGGRKRNKRADRARKQKERKDEGETVKGVEITT